jgi:hypothetical protein
MVVLDNRFRGADERTVTLLADHYVVFARP